MVSRIFARLRGSLSRHVNERWELDGKILGGCTTVFFKCYMNVIMSRSGSFSNESMTSTCFFFGSKTLRGWELIWNFSSTEVLGWQRWAFITCCAGISKTGMQWNGQFIQSGTWKGSNLAIVSKESPCSHDLWKETYIVLQNRSGILDILGISHYTIRQICRITLLSTGCEGTLPVNCGLDLQNGWTRVLSPDLL